MTSCCNRTNKKHLRKASFRGQVSQVQSHNVHNMVINRYKVENIDIYIYIYIYIDQRVEYTMILVASATPMIPTLFCNMWLSCLNND